MHEKEQMKRNLKLYEFTHQRHLNFYVNHFLYQFAFSRRIKKKWQNKLDS